MSRIDVGDRVGDVGAGAGAIWVTRHLGNRGAFDLVKLDMASGKVVSKPLPLQGSGGSIAASEDALWVATGPFEAGGGAVPGGGVIRLDPATRRVVARIRLRGASSVAVGEYGVWVTNPEEGSVSRIDPSTNQVVATVSLGGHPESIVMGEGAVWVDVEDRVAFLHRIDPSSNRVTATSEVGLAAVGLDAVWAIGPWAPNGALRRLDPVTLRPTGPVLGFDILPARIAIAGPELWVGKFFYYCKRHSSTGEGPPIVSFAWYRVDPITLEPLSGPVFVGEAGTPVFAAGSFWIDDDLGNEVIRIDLAAAGGVRSTPTPGLPSPATPSL